jgi:hypothetical protein
MGTDRARCSPPAPRSLDSPASFATDLVGSLGRALDGTRRIDMTRDQAASDLIQVARRVQEDFATNAAAGWYQVLSNEGFRSADAP